MKRKIILASLLLPFFGFGQWSSTTLQGKKSDSRHQSVKEAKYFKLDQSSLQAQLKDAPEKFSGKKGAIISIPNAEGKIEKYQVWEFSNFSPELQAKYPNIKSYMGVGVTDPTSYLRLSVSDFGVSTFVNRAGKSEFIEPFAGDRSVYGVYESSARLKSEDEEFICSTPFSELAENAETSETSKASNQIFKTFRLAVSTNGEYSQYHVGLAGETGATDEVKKAVVLAAINATMTRVNGVFERDLAVHLNLIDNLSIIFLDPNTDPYGSMSTSTVQTVMNTYVENENYDIGHLFAFAAPNGSAGYIGGVCTNGQKGSAFTSHRTPISDVFDIDYVAHEMGHQLGANHTFTYGYEGSVAQVEPGSGNTIMAYTGITQDYDVQFNSNDFFSVPNLNQIQTRLNSKTCSVNTPITNTPPVVDAGANYTIPQSTPFLLKGTASDADGDAMIYSWEQNNTPTSAFTGSNSITYPTKTSGPMFKAYAPGSSKERYFPNYNMVLSGLTTTKWESLASVGRSMSFNFTARDNSANGPQTATDQTIITVNAAAGPFVTTAPAFGAELTSGTNFTVTWDVANTNVAPVNTQFVNILLSKDGGETFTTLLANTANDGSEQVAIPANSISENAFIKVEAVDNVYFALSPSFVIDYEVNGETCETYTYSGAAVPINDGTGGSISSPKVELPLTVANTGTITKISVKPQVTHPNVYQLTLGIENPAGGTALFWNRTCSGRANLAATFTDNGTAAAASCTNLQTSTIKSTELLNLFRGSKANGTWKLYASDNQFGVTGTVNSWALTVCTREVEEAQMGTAAKGLAQDIKVYPNPSNGNFFIKSRQQEVVNVAVFDLSGRQIYKTQYNSTQGEFTKEMNLNLAKGVYILQMSSAKGNNSQKLIIK